MYVCVFVQATSPGGQEEAANGGEGGARGQGFQRLGSVLLDAFADRNLSAPRVLDTLIEYYVQEVRPL